MGVTLLLPQIAPVKPRKEFNNNMELRVISWNACGIRDLRRLAALKGYVYKQKPSVIFIQEAFVGPLHGERLAPPLTGYISYVHPVRNGLITYVHSSITHRLLRTSVDPEMTFQLLEVAMGHGIVRLCNVYSAPGPINLPALPSPTLQGTIYMGDFNARHPDLGDSTPTPNRNGPRLLDYVKRYGLTRWDTGGATHSRGGTLDHIFTKGLVASRVKCFPIHALFSDHIAIGLHYSVSATPLTTVTRNRITIPPKYCPTYISYMATMLPTSNMQSPDEFYSSLVKYTQEFYTRYVTRPHLPRRQGTHATGRLEDRVIQAERKAVEHGIAFQAQPTPAHLRQYQSSRDELIALQQCAQNDSWLTFTDSINHLTTVGSMWNKINKIVKKRSHTALHHSPTEYAQHLIDTWSAQSQFGNLPATIQDALSSESHLRSLRLVDALLIKDEEDDVPITPDELRRALAHGTASAPGDDGITYSVLRLLQKVPGNPLLQLYNLCFRMGYVPETWTSSTIIPIPKPGTDKFRPISLTSCFSKVLERIFLNRLMFRLQSKLSPRLYGFMAQRGTHHCLLELYTRLSPTSVVAFIDLKSAFDIANREVILDQLVSFGVRGNLLRWIRSYLSNRTARVLFKGSCSTSKSFDLGTPQGGVLSPFLFNVLMHRLISLLPDIAGTSITCYADDICIHSNSSQDLQRFLYAFYTSSTSCGFVISPEKSRIFSTRNPQTLPAFTMGGSVVPHCTQYIYLGAPVRITPAMPARQRIHPIVKDLLDRLEKRFIPIKWLANNMRGVSIPVARNIYIAFLRSVVDYLSPALCQLPKTSLEPLEKFQNRVMRFILGCPSSTRIVNMLSELNLTPLVSRIYSNVTFFSVKSLHSPHLAPHYSQVIRAALDLNTPRPRLRPAGRNLVRTVCADLRRLEIEVPAAEIVSVLPPWRVPHPIVSFTPTCKADHPILQKQLALETIASESASDPEAHHIYVDGSVQADMSAACAMFSKTINPPEDNGWVGRRLPNSSSSTYCELNGILDAVTLLNDRKLNGLIICDSKTALHAIAAPRSAYESVVQNILEKLANARDNALSIRFIWIPSHVGLEGNDIVDGLAKAACALNLPGVRALSSLRCYKNLLSSAISALTVNQRNNERAASVSIRHYDHFINIKNNYRRHGLMVRRHNVVSARIRLGYRPLWQVSQVEDMPHYSMCKLCSRPNANNLEHYCLACPVVRDMLPHEQDLINICKYILQDDNLDLILVRHKHFGGC